MRRIVAAGALAMALALPLAGAAQASESAPKSKSTTSKVTTTYKWKQYQSERKPRTVKRGVYVTVRKGDTLYGLARKHYGPGLAPFAWKWIRSMNPEVKGTTIYVGQRLRVR